MFSIFHFYLFWGEVVRRFICSAFFAVSLVLLSGGITSTTKAETELLMDKPVLSPDGTHIAFLRTVESETVLLVMDLSNGGVNLMRKPDEMEFRWHLWANNERLLLSFEHPSDRYEYDSRYEERNILNDLRDEDINVRVRVVIRPITRLFSSDKTLQSFDNLFKVGGIRQRGIRVTPQAMNVINQDHVIDVLPDDPEHFLMAVDNDGNGESEVRLVDISDGSFETIIKEHTGIYDWVTDQNHQLRIGYGYVVESERRIVNFIYYLNPTKNEWEYISIDNWDNQVVEIYGFAEDPRFAYIRNSKAQLVLHDLVENKTVEFFSEAGGYFLPRTEFDYRPEPYGYYHNREIKYLDQDYTDLMAMIDGVLTEGLNTIVSSVEELEKYIILNRAHGEGGTYYLLDLGAGSLNKISDRYADD